MYTRKLYHTCLVRSGVVGDGVRRVYIMSPFFLNDSAVTCSRWRWFSLLIACGSTSVCLQFMYPAWTLQSRRSLSGANPCGTNRVWTGVGVTALNATVFDIGAALKACRCIFVFKPTEYPSCLIMYVEWKRRPMREMLASWSSVITQSGIIVGSNSAGPALQLYRCIHTIMYSPACIV